jgi:hypothetical protein
VNYYMGDATNGYTWVGEDRRLCSLVEFFTRHSLPEEAVAALKQLHVAAEDGNLRTEVLEEIQQWLRV